MRVLRAFIALFLCLTPRAFSQVPDICSIAFTQGIRNNYDVLTEEDRFNLYKQRILNLKSDTYESFRASAQSAGIDLPLAEGLLGLTGKNDEKQSQFKSHYEEFRSATYNQAKYRYYFQSHTSEISSDLLRSWNTCVSLYYATWVSQKGVAASIVPLDDFRRFVVTLDVKPSFLNKVKIIALEPTGQVACRYSNDLPVQPGKTTIDTAAFTMTCSKDPSIVIPFVVNTGAGRSETITVPAASSKVAERSGSHLRDKSRHIAGIRKIFLC